LRASAAAISTTQQPFVATAGNAFPDNHYHINTLQVGLDFVFTRRLGMRVFDLYEIGGFSDWHYAGLAAGQVLDHKLYTDRGPPSRYGTNVLGVLLNVKL
jgi:hypothetical protein